VEAEHSTYRNGITQSVQSNIRKVSGQNKSQHERTVTFLFLLPQNVHNISCSVTLYTSLPCCGCGWSVLLPRLFCPPRGGPLLAPVPPPVPSSFRVAATAYTLCRTPHSFRSFALELGRDIDDAVPVVLGRFNFAAAAGGRTRLSSLPPCPYPCPSVDPPRFSAH
jgi:hypothetical protein